MPAEFLRSLVGTWAGTCSTWFEPGKLVDEAHLTITAYNVPGLATRKRANAWLRTVRVLDKMRLVDSLRQAKMIQRAPTTIKETDTMNEAAKNAETVRRGYAAFNAADMKTLTELFHESASWHTPGRSPLAGDRKGRDAIFALFGRYGGDTGGTFKAALQQVLTSDDGRVVGIHRNTATRGGKQLDVVCCLVFEFKDGRVVDGREYFYDLHAWDQFWS